MDMEVVRQSSTSVQGTDPVPRPAAANMFQVQRQTPAAVLPDATAEADKLPSKYFKDLLKLQSDKTIADFAQSADKNPDELARLASKAKRDAMAQGAFQNPTGLSYGFPTPNPTLKPSDIKMVVEADRRVFGSTTQSRAQLPVQGGKVGINWDRQLRKTG